jgi:hypothetical protein
MKPVGNCPHNEGVICDGRRNCTRCGFHPSVEARRKQAIREKKIASVLSKDRGKTHGTV